MNQGIGLMSCNMDIYFEIINHISITNLHKSHNCDTFIIRHEICLFFWKHACSYRFHLVHHANNEVYHICNYNANATLTLLSIPWNMAYQHHTPPTVVYIITWLQICVKAPPVSLMAGNGTTNTWISSEPLVTHWSMLQECLLIKAVSSKLYPG